ncbi:hypothetical protein RO3G_03358 [Rhizopus delemar RA 99-880]|uniref:ER membrane protein complex subunit 2 n=1 Tax=Rhizopus delemar (strain RA 99-880 / ATCC MYA-4621 / FGSC 9543 / NRRL 43880) TaxID=246409 RepID=I1BR24_RHIO9|nr:hypothetical protein RO3G_03358 [Rhizopus delemar RA 99-880]|eukprot:EIE78654.1 hypothetical protein RO3G_03358 [Rhizopus delemar RA 99-880]
MSRFDFAKAIEELQQLRTTNERSSERITNIGQRIIDDNYTSKLGDQVWPFYEQVTIAALDTQNMTLANACDMKHKVCWMKHKKYMTVSCKKTKPTCWHQSAKLPY